MIDELVEVLGMLSELVDTTGWTGTPSGSYTLDLDRVREIAHEHGLACRDCAGAGTVDRGDPARRDPAVEDIHDCDECGGWGWRTDAPITMDGPDMMRAKGAPRGDQR